jgi:hypothetical protein
MHQLIQQFSECAQVGTLDEDTTVNVEQYLHYLGIDGRDASSPHADLARQKFSWHDLDGNGKVSFHEAQLLCNADGCT